MKILELSDDQYFITNGQSHIVESYYTGHRTPPERAITLTLSKLLSLRRRIFQKEFDLIALSSLSTPLIFPGAPFKTLQRWIAKGLSASQLLLHQALGLFLKDCPIPILFYHRKDTPILHATHFPLMELADQLFVREIPQNNYNLFLYTTPKNEDVVNLMRNPKYTNFFKKMHSIPLGSDPLPLPAPLQKQTDVFYAGKNHTSSVRAKGILELQKLAKAGYTVDLPTERLSREEFLQRMAQAWICWSPEGQGWDCFRHYESLLVGSVPLINYPTIERCHPLEENTHCFFYSVEAGNLGEKIKALLKNKENLERVSKQGREFVQRHHLHARILEEMIQITMGAASDALFQSSQS